jgi:hypothetical protein
MVDIHRHGTTRTVICFGPWAFKIAKKRRGDRSRGIRCNKFEAKTWATTSKRNQRIICPVLWSFFGGRVLMMRRAEAITEAEAQELNRTNGFPKWDYRPTDGFDELFEAVPKAADWGRIDGRLVCLDYSTPVIAAEIE